MKIQTKKQQLSRITTDNYIVRQSLKKLMILSLLALTLGALFPTQPAQAYVWGSPYGRASIMPNWWHLANLNRNNGNHYNYNRIGFFGGSAYGALGYGMAPIYPRHYMSRARQEIRQNLAQYKLNQSLTRMALQKKNRYYLIKAQQLQLQQRLNQELNQQVPTIQIQNPETKEVLDTTPHGANHKPTPIETLYLEKETVVMNSY